MLKCAPVVVMAVPLVCLEYSMVIFLFSDFFSLFSKTRLGMTTMCKIKTKEFHREYTDRIYRVLYVEKENGTRHKPISIYLTGSDSNACARERSQFLHVFIYISSCSCFFSLIISSIFSTHSVRSVFFVCTFICMFHIQHGHDDVLVHISDVRKSSRVFFLSSFLSFRFCQCFHAVLELMCVFFFSSTFPFLFPSPVRMIFARLFCRNSCKVYELSSANISFTSFGSFVRK